MHDIYQKFESAALSNGLTVYNLNWPDRTGVRFEFIIHSGLRQDPPGKEGVAHFMEHLISENAMIPSEDLRRFFEHNAGERPMLGTTSHSGTYYSFFSSKHLLQKSLTYFGHMLLQASLVKEVERERQVIFGEYNRKYSMQILHDIGRRMRDAAYPNTFFKQSLCSLGSKETIGSITQKDLQNFYDKHYTPANMSIVSVGELSLEEVIEALENSPFGEYKSGTRTPLSPTIKNPPHPTETHFWFHQGEFFVGKDSADLASSAQLPGTLTASQIRIAEEMLRNMLFKVIRLENAWTYHIGCDSINFGDFHQFNIKCDSFNVSALDHISDVVNECIEGCREQSESFNESKQKILLGKRYSDPNMRSVARFAREDLLLFNRIVTLTEELREVEQTQMEDITQVIDYLCPERRWTMIGYP